MIQFLDFIVLYDAVQREFMNESLSGSESTRFRNLLKKAIVAFRYRKKNGKLRTAHGTLQKKMLPKYKTAKRPKSNLKNFVYFDVDKNQFRSFARDSFVGIIKDEKKKTDAKEE